MYGATIIFSSPEKGCARGHGYRWTDSLSRRNVQ